MNSEKYELERTSQPVQLEGRGLCDRGLDDVSRNGKLFKRLSKLLHFDEGLL